MLSNLNLLFVFAPASSLRKRLRTLRPEGAGLTESEIYYAIEETPSGGPRSVQVPRPGTGVAGPMVFVGIHVTPPELDAMRAPRIKRSTTSVKATKSPATRAASRRAR